MLQTSIISQYFQESTYLSHLNPGNLFTGESDEKSIFNDISSILLYSYGLAQPQHPTTA